MSPDAQPEPLVPGPDGAPVPGGLRVIRMANEPKVENLSPEFVRRVQEGKALPSFFELSSEDKLEAVPRLSVWLEPLTTVAQAWVLVGANVRRRWVLFLEVDRVREVRAPANNQLSETPCLDVVWERATVPLDTGERVPETRAGWEGHAGIPNLDCGNKTQKAFLRSELANHAVVRILTDDELATFGDVTSTGASSPE
jgi:hypothetical protein